MKKIYLIESLGFVAIKLQQSIESNLKDAEVVVSDGKLLNVKNSDYLLGDVDLIVLDLDKSTLNLHELVAGLKKSSVTAHIPVLVISSSSDYKTLRDVIAAGCQDFILKPILDNTLINKVSKWLYKEATVTAEYDSHNLKDIQSEVSIQLVWNDAFKTGIEEIDFEHKRIVDSYQRLYTLMKAGKGHDYYKELINFLDTYVEEHFEHEEAFQKSIDYIHYEAHCQLHSAFKCKVKAILDSHDSDEVSNLDLINISVFIKDLLLHHILIEDTKIGTYYEEKFNKSKG